jgi:acetyl-CoA C-acetyltransferase
MPQTVILGTARTPFGKMGGALASKSAIELGGEAISAALDRSGVDPEQVQQVVYGQVLQAGQGQIPSRQAQIEAGIPKAVPSETVNKVCASGMRSLGLADQAIRAGDVEVTVTGGMESMSGAPYLLPQARFGFRMGDAKAIDAMTHDGLTNPFTGKQMINEASEVSNELELTRPDMDRWAARSHQLAAKATDEGRLADEIVGVTVKSKKSESVVEADEAIRPDSTVETLAKLRPIMGKDDAEATVTAGNASGQNDGAAVAIVTTPEKAAELGLRPLARLVSWGVAGVPPRTMGIGPVPATAKALAQADLKLSDVDLIELNEAFASQVLAVTREWGFTATDFGRTNVNGSGISLGHPVGATGGRILATLLREMDRRQARYGLETMCIGGGQGLAAIFERVAA